jgi:hypothetical protein
MEGQAPNIQKPLPLLNADLLSPKDRVDRQRHLELQELERLHEVQTKEQYQQRQQKLYHQQGGIFHSNFDAESWITGRLEEVDKEETMHEYVIAIRGAQAVFGVLIMSFMAYGKFSRAVIWKVC